MATHNVIPFHVLPIVQIPKGPLMIPMPSIFNCLWCHAIPMTDTSKCCNTQTRGMASVPLKVHVSILLCLPCIPCNACGLHACLGSKNQLSPILCPTFLADVCGNRSAVPIRAEKHHVSGQMENLREAAAAREDRAAGTVPRLCISRLRLEAESIGCFRCGHRHSTTDPLPQSDSLAAVVERHLWHKLIRCTVAYAGCNTSQQAETDLSHAAHLYVRPIGAQLGSQSGRVGKSNMRKQVA